jgi:branched-chain amino acid transport system substrate-binding protein
VNQQLIDSVPPETVEGIFTIAPSPAEGSPAYKHLTDITGIAAPDPYTTQSYDHANLVLLAMAAAGEASGTAIRDNIRRVSQTPGGLAVGNITDGLKAIAAKQGINYDGASGPCDFTPIGDIIDCKFRYEQVKAGHIGLLRIA